MLEIGHKRILDPECHDCVLILKPTAWKCYIGATHLVFVFVLQDMLAFPHVRAQEQTLGDGCSCSSSGSTYLLHFLLWMDEKTQKRSVSCENGVLLLLLLPTSSHQIFLMKFVTNRTIQLLTQVIGA